MKLGGGSQSSGEFDKQKKKESSCKEGNKGKTIIYAKERITRQRRTFYFHFLGCGSLSLRSFS